MTVATRPHSPAPAPIPSPDLTAIGELRRIPLSELVESPWNPRKHFDPTKLAEMADSLKKGQLAPIIVRPWTHKERGDKVATPYYEIGAGHRRFRSAPAAGLTSLLAIVREMDDVAFLELLNIANKQRDDIEPLDEAEGFKLLMEKAGYKVERLAERIGLSKQYVYDRLKLLQLIPELKKLLREKVITAGHAILLARLTSADQKRVMGNPKTINRAYGAGSGLFEGEDADHDPDQPGLELKLPVKAVSVRELATYINDHVRFKPEENDLPNLFPAAAVALKAAETDDLDPVYITYDHSLRYDAKDRKVRTYGVGSWRRADGEKKSKTCAWSRIGIVAAGRDRGDAFRVCVNRDKCEVHFPQSARAAKRRKKAATPAVTGGREPTAAELRKQQESLEEEQLWDELFPLVLEERKAEFLAGANKRAAAFARVPADSLFAILGDNDLWLRAATEYDSQISNLVQPSLPGKWKKIYGRAEPKDAAAARQHIGLKLYLALDTKKLDTELEKATDAATAKAMKAKAKEMAELDGAKKKPAKKKAKKGGR